MGSLELPESGFVYVDTQAVIYSVEVQAPYWSCLEPVWEAAQAGRFGLVTSELTLMEVLVGPLKRDDKLLVRAYEEIFKTAQIRLSPITQSILRDAARLRATIPTLRTPDALHAATALDTQCALFLTNDAGFRCVPGLPLTLLSDALPC